MAEYGVTEKGFNRKDYNTILTEMDAELRGVWGDDVDLSDVAIEGVLIKIVAQRLAERWMSEEAVYLSAYIDFAEDVSLDNVTKLIGVSRKSLNKAIVPVRITADVGTSIDKNRRIEVEGTDIGFLLDETLRVGPSKVVTTTATAESYGSKYNIQSETITRFTNAIPGVITVTNTAPGTGGLDKELDPLYKERYEKEVSRGGAGPIDAIIAAVRQVTTDCMAFQNNTNEIDVEGRPPKSVEVVALGGTDSDIAAAIFSVTVGGIETVGEVSVDVQDSAGTFHTMKFNRATAKDVYVTVNLVKNIEYPGDDEVMDTVISYIGGVKTDDSQVVGLSFDKDVITSKVNALIGIMNGVDDVNVYIGTSEGPTETKNIEVTQAEVAQTAPDKVVINYV